METKICRNTTCGLEKPISEFPKNKQYADGYSSWCRVCHNSYCAQERHKIRCRDNKRKWRQNPEYKAKEQRQALAYRVTQMREMLLRSARDRARLLNIPFNLELNDIPEITELCPILKVKMQRGTSYAPSLDKIDPTVGYIKGNVQIISRKANSMKLNATKEELLKFSRYWIKKHKLGKL